MNPNASIESVNDGQEAAAGTFHGADDDDDYVAVRVDVHGVVDAVVDLAASDELFATADDHFDGQKLDELVEDVKRREEDQVPRNGERRKSDMFAKLRDRVARIPTNRPRPERGLGES